MLARRSVGLACSLAVAGAFCPAASLVHESAPMQLAGRSRSICGPAAPSMSHRSECDDALATPRRKVVLSFGALATSQLLPLSPFWAGAEDDAVSGAKVCENPLGCEIPKKLAPPKRVFKDIFEEERELARQREELAEQARAEQRAGQQKQIAASFAQIKKGRDDFEREVREALGKVEVDAADAQAWDDIRRMSRLYDTGLRKDGMFPAADRIKKAKLEFDRKSSDSFCSSLNASLKSLDGAAKKKDVATVNSKLEEALGSLDSWLALEPKA